MELRPFLRAAYQACASQPLGLLGARGRLALPRPVTPIAASSAPRFFSSTACASSPPEATPSSHLPRSMRKPGVPAWRTPNSSRPTWTDPKDSDDLSDQIDELQSTMNSKVQSLMDADFSSDAMPAEPLKFKSQTGRTVAVQNKTDLARAIGLLQVICRRDGIWHMAKKQKTYERPGLKAKRQRMERWRKRFKKGFQAHVQRVQELTKQGW